MSARNRMCKGVSENTHNGAISRELDEAAASSDGDDVPNGVDASLHSVITHVDELARTIHG